jgi:hypothetical protein
VFLVAGFFLSFLINTYIGSHTSGSSTIENAAFWSITVPGGAVIILTAMRWIGLALVAAPIILRQELDSDSYASILATPIHDADIFMAESFSGIMRGWGLFVQTGSFVVGLIPAHLVVMVDTLGRYGIAESSAAIGGVFEALWIVLMLVVLGANAGILYASLMRPSYVVVAVLAHTVVLFFLSNPMLFWIILHYGVFGGGLDALVLLIHAIGVTVATFLTVGAGVYIFSRMRRSGFFEPERTLSGDYVE